MFLKNAFLSEEDKYRYVIEKDPKTNKIYLLGWETGLPHIKREVEYAKDNLQVMYRYSNINSKEVKLQIIFNN